MEEGEKGRFRFHNNCNYLAVEGKTPCILTLVNSVRVFRFIRIDVVLQPPGPKNNRQVEFRVHDVLGSTEYISFESCATKNYFLAVDTNGHLRLSQIKEKRPEFLFSIIAVVSSLFVSKDTLSLLQSLWLHLLRRQCQFMLLLLLLRHRTFPTLLTFQLQLHLRLHLHLIQPSIPSLNHRHFIQN